MSTESHVEVRENGFVILHQDGREYTIGHRDAAGAWHAGGCCGRKLRNGRSCTMDHDHRGRCSSVTFCCDDCGKHRRGTPAYKDENIIACFMCVAGSEHGYHSDGPAIYLGMTAKYKRYVRETRERRRKQIHERYIASESRRATS